MEASKQASKGSRFPYQQKKRGADEWISPPVNSPVQDKSPHSTGKEAEGIEDGKARTRGGGRAAAVKAI